MRKPKHAKEALIVTLSAAVTGLLSLHLGYDKGSCDLPLRPALFVGLSRTGGELTKAIVAV